MMNRSICTVTIKQQSVLPRWVKSILDMFSRVQELPGSPALNSASNPAMAHSMNFLL